MVEWYGIFLTHIMVDLIINFDSKIHNLCDRREYHVIVLLRYLIIIPKISIDVLMHIK